MGLVRVLLTAIVAAASVFVAFTPDARAARVALQIDDGFLARGATAWNEATDLGVDTVRVDLRWNLVAPTAPRRPRQPSDPAYVWSGIDAAVESSTAQGRAVILSIGGTPDWARADRGRGGSPGDPAFLPRRAAWRSFVVAVATRYSGAIDPDGNGPRGVLPRVELIEVWPAPNRSSNLRPQRRGKRLVSVALYKRLHTNAAAMLAKVANARGYEITVISGGVATARDASDTDPLAFLSSMGRARLRPSEVGLRLAPPDDAPARLPAAYALTNLSGILGAVDGAWRGAQPGVWLIDYGLTSGPAGSGADEAIQAAGVDALLTAAADPRVRYAEWRVLQDASGGDGAGLRAADGRPKAAWASWVARPTR